MAWAEDGAGAWTAAAVGSHCAESTIVTVDGTQSPEAVTAALAAACLQRGL